ncbi:putative methyltransferase C9orf114 homolog isoform X2 [Zingiber officinale]|uniref:putative methyltransferase C9orf114 homolog isoform X2 n=1 Tax=Zingiber officinale TaxID=94328 RepID=UPI001C4CC603|nr:putative methyltransferase C9orf114 homolog isoform X2 [Zingiber officinale]
MKNDAATENDHVRLRDGSDSTGDGVRRKKRKEGKKGKGEEKRKKRKEKKPTVSIAVAGSIIDNAQSLELATLLAGQVARAATIFRIDEVVVFGNKASADDDSIHPVNNEESQSGALFLVRILQYLETPQYLRRRLFPMHKSLKFVGLLPPLDAPHHLRKHEWCPFREGVTLDANPSNSEGTSVDVGLNKTILVEGVLEPGKRVTVAMGENRSTELDGFKKVVSSSQRDQIGIYWGYKVRYASNLSNVFKNCSYKHGYDHIIGTSEHGLVVNSSELEIPSFRHFLIVFGGLAGLEESIKEDDSLKGKDVHDVFNSYLNTCPLQGSRTIRTEEAIFISLQFFQDPIKRAQQQCNGK